MECGVEARDLRYVAERSGHRIDGGDFGREMRGREGYVSADLFSECIIDPARPGISGSAEHETMTDTIGGGESEGCELCEGSLECRPLIGKVSSLIHVRGAAPLQDETSLRRPDRFDRTRTLEVLAGRAHAVDGHLQR
jgi:hypothetical protein